MESIPLRANPIVPPVERGLTVYSATPKRTARLVVPETAQTHQMLALCGYPGLSSARHWAVSLIPAAPLAVAFARDLAVKLMRAALPAQSQALGTWREAQCLALCAQPPDADLQRARSRLALALEPLVEAGHWVGISRPCAGIHELETAIQEAIETARACQNLRRHAIGHRAQLALYETIHELRGSEPSVRLADEVLAPLQRYDRRHGTDLVDTLAVFLRENGNAVQASRRLAVHRNTLNYRLQRIIEISGLDLDQADERLMLHLALCVQADL